MCFRVCFFLIQSIKLQSTVCRTLEKAPYHFAATQLKLGTAYVMIAETENMSENYMLGTKAFDEALSVFTEENYPESDEGLAMFRECCVGWGEAITLLKVYLEKDINYKLKF